MTVCCLLEGDIDVSYTRADNTPVVATDSIKNTIYIKAKQHPVNPPELFASYLGQHFLDTYAHITAAKVTVVQHRWTRMAVGGQPHPHSFHRDGAMRVDGNSGNGATYEPNSFNVFQEQPDFSEPPLSLEGAADHWNHREDSDYFSQPRALYNLLSDEEHQRMFTRIAGEMKDVPDSIQARQIDLFNQVHPEYGAGVANALNALKQDG